MTRINIGVHPSELTTRHLLAEHREIKRIPNCVRSGRFSMKDQPKNFKLGDGHVKFFYDKLGYLRTRYESIYIECCKRGYNVQNFIGAFDGIDPRYMGDYQPTAHDRQIILERIEQRLTKV